jgi:hypothetical protein
MIILNVRFGRELLVITASISTTASGENACVRSWPLPDIRQFQKAYLNTGRSDL